MKIVEVFVFKNLDFRTEENSLFTVFGVFLSFHVALFSLFHYLTSIFRSCLFAMSGTVQVCSVLCMLSVNPHATHFSVLYLIVGGVWQGLSQTLLKFFAG